MIETEGKWNRDSGTLYFLSSAMRNIYYGCGLYGPFPADVLIPVNEINSDADHVKLRKILALGGNVMMDSGCFALANAHARNHHIALPEALALPPEELDGFEALLAKFVGLVKTYGGQIWGYVEIDIGGRERKIQTRAKLEALGLRPMPVYHPFSDGWDYFDHLAERYDRICLANLNSASIGERKRLVATAWERRRKYPHLWIHALGISASPLLVNFPLDSCDSSAWLDSTRWGEFATWAATLMLWPTEAGWRYDSKAPSGEPQDSPRGTSAAYALLGFDKAMMGRTLRRMLDDQEAAVGCDRRML